MNEMIIISFRDPLKIRYLFPLISPKAIEHFQRIGFLFIHFHIIVAVALFYNLKYVQDFDINLNLNINQSRKWFS